ncbi:MAG: DinB family protein [Holophaga sp.]|nr:DinB family protein [Holophaga sp.]
MNPAARGELLMEYARGPAQLKAALAKVPKESLDFKPGKDKWSIQDIVFHLAEAELHGYLRGRTIIAESGAGIQAFDQDRWAGSLEVGAQPMDEVVDLFRLLREMMARQLRALPEAAWGQFAVHSERGKITLEQWLETYVGHLDAHLAQIDRTYQASIQH